MRGRNKAAEIPPADQSITEDAELSYARMHLDMAAALEGPKYPRLNRLGRGLGIGLLWIGSLVLVDAAYHVVLDDAGPKNGITKVDDESCDVVAGFGPAETADGKLTGRLVRASGLVYVELLTRQLPESEARADVGRISAPAVTVNDLLIECPQLPSGMLPPVTTNPHYVSLSMPSALPPLGGSLLSSYSS